MDIASNWPDTGTECSLFAEAGVDEVEKIHQITSHLQVDKKINAKIIDKNMATLTQSQQETKLK